MKAEDFEIVVSKLDATCNEVLLNRAKQYSSTADRLHNFRMAAKMQRCSAVRALNAMRLKQEISLNDLVNNYSEFGELSTPAMWKEKIIDDINYLKLLYAMCMEDNLI